MKTVTSETVPFTAQQMYDLVVDMDAYATFIPWCAAARKLEETDEQFIAEITFTFKGMRETFRTLDKVIPGKQVDISLKSGPFRRLSSQWRFIDLEQGGSKIDFSIDFQFKNKLMDLALGSVFGTASKKMVATFRKRAFELYDQK
ncbi:MAG: type II toxin-antitoxin system RatA family toxin [Magnetococcales bacterium]|nr:type II toxin-antitoxin system RatA family toxin [Magnetococcales bacterium]